LTQELTPESQVLQEMASRGMSVVYSIGDDAARKQLLDGLVGVLQGAYDPAIWSVSSPS